MEPEPHKIKPLSKEETRGLLSLIEGSQIIYNKKTNATSNKMKVEEWQRIADAFNATIGLCRRTPQQLRLKWENLKKNARKRNTLMRMERIKTGGGPQPFFHPDDILDRVAALLGTTGEGLVVMFGGDAESSFGDGGGSSSGTIDIVTPNYGIVPLMDNSLSVTCNSPSTSMNYEATPAVPTDNEISDNGTGGGLVKDMPIYAHTPNISKKVYFKSSGVKRKLLKPDDGRLARNMALAEYYKTKKDFIDSRQKFFDAEIEKIKLENDKLKLEIRKLKGED